jgi:hypothetical protein
MNPLDIHLKFPDQATATAELVKAGVWLKFTDQDKKVVYGDAPSYLTDVIGLIFKPIDAAVDVGGWHVNMRGKLPDTIKLYRVIVTGTPHRIWD